MLLSNNFGVLNTNIINLRCGYNLKDPKEPKWGPKYTYKTDNQYSAYTVGKVWGGWGGVGLSAMIAIKYYRSQ